MPKHIFVTGGVASSLGKGLTASSLGRLLKLRGLRVTLQKALFSSPAACRESVRNRVRRLQAQQAVREGRARDQGNAAAHDDRRGRAQRREAAVHLDQQRALGVRGRTVDVEVELEFAGVQFPEIRVVAEAEDDLTVSVDLLQTREPAPAPSVEKTFPPLEATE